MGKGGAKMIAAGMANQDKIEDLKKIASSVSDIKGKLSTVPLYQGLQDELKSLICEEDYNEFYNSLKNEFYNSLKNEFWKSLED